jgi:DinB superfamily
MTSPDTYRLGILRDQSQQLTHEVGLMPTEALLWRPAEGEWSVQECLAHIRNIEQKVFLVRIGKVVKETEPFIANFDEFAYHREHWTADEPVTTILPEFVAARAQLIGLLETADWARTGTHEERGPISLDWLAAYVTNHTWEHMSQLMRVRLNYFGRKTQD